MEHAITPLEQTCQVEESTLVITSPSNFFYPCFACLIAMTVARLIKRSADLPHWKTSLGLSQKSCHGPYKGNIGELWVGRYVTNWRYVSAEVLIFKCKCHRGKETSTAFIVSGCSVVVVVWDFGGMVVCWVFFLWFLFFWEGVVVGGMWDTGIGMVGILSDILKRVPKFAVAKFGV